MTSGASLPDDPPADTEAHVFVADLDAPHLDDGDRHHLVQVLRLRPGAPVTAGDGAGRVRNCRMGRSGVLEASGEVVEVAAPHPRLTVGVALTKGSRPELAVQKLTELGIDRIVPFVAARSVVRWDGDRARHHSRRLARIAREAAMQSRRAYLPALDDVAALASVAAMPGAALCQRGGRPPSLADQTVLVGPEGGWSLSELELGLPCVGLGPQVLRAETAAVAVASVLVALRSGLVAPAEAGGPLRR